VAEILFYHLTKRNLENVLPRLLEKTLERGQRAIVHTGSVERLKVLDELLWSYDEASFLPHSVVGEPDIDQDPIVLTTEAVNPNNADVRFVVDGAEMPESIPHKRCVLMFDGRDEEAVAKARVAWKSLKALPNHELTYWQEDETGRWKQVA
jgi:DNA polymerase III subunit chi